MIKICARVDSSCTTAEKRLRRPLQVFGTELKTFPSYYFVKEELHYHYEARVPTKKCLKLRIDAAKKAYNPAVHGTCAWALEGK